jgi:hypothetical protein
MPTNLSPTALRIPSSEAKRFLCRDLPPPPLRLRGRGWPSFLGSPKSNFISRRAVVSGVLGRGYAPRLKRL